MRSVTLSANEETACIMRNMLGRLQKEVLTRFLRLGNLNTTFVFLLYIKTFLSNIINVDDHSIETICTLEIFMTLIYIVNSRELFTELVGCKMLLSTWNKIQPKNHWVFLILFFCGDGFFLNLWNSLHILLTIAVSIAIYERSFKLNFRDTMGQEVLRISPFLALNERH